MPTTVDLGNTAPTGAPEAASAVTRFQVPDDVGLVEAVTSITRVYPQHHSDDPPEWVESSDATLAGALAAAFTTGEHTCTTGRPEGWEGDDFETEENE